MWRLTFPLFTLKLLGTFALTSLQAVAFQFGSQKLVVVNLGLTLLAIGLAVGWWFLPPAGQPTSPTLGISLQNAPDIKPVYQAVDTTQLKSMLETYESASLQQPFIPQYRYVNLALIAAAAHQYSLANQFANLARSIDPNQDFFSD